MSYISAKNNTFCMVDFAFLGAGSRPIIILGVYRGAEETPEILKV